MEYIHITKHKFQKTNLITIVKGKKIYDEYTCEYCGLSGKRYGFSEFIEVKKDRKCTYKPIQITIPASITIIKCEAYGKQFANLTPGSVHTVIDPPSGYKNDEKGVWVMGVGEPVKVLQNEYK